MKNFNTHVNFVETRQSLPPLVPEEKEEIKGGVPEQTPQSMFSKYV